MEYTIRWERTLSADSESAAAQAAWNELRDPLADVVLSVTPKAVVVDFAGEAPSPAPRHTFEGVTYEAAPETQGCVGCAASSPFTTRHGLCDALCKASPNCVTGRIVWVQAQ